mgnify:FL=1
MVIFAVLYYAPTPEVLAAHLGGYVTVSDSTCGSVSISKSVSSTNPTSSGATNGSVSVTTTVSSNGCSTLEWAIKLYGQIGSSNVQTTTANDGYWYQNGTGKSETFTFSNLGAGDYTVSGDAILYYKWNGSYYYYATLSTTSGTVTLSNPSPPPPPSPPPDLISLTFTGNDVANPTVDYNGSVVLGWSVTNASDGCAASGDWTGVRATGSNNTETRTGLTSNKYYTLTCTQPGEVVTKTVDVTVRSPTVSVTLDPQNDFGLSPLKNQSLTATLNGGTATGDTRYQFDCLNDDNIEKDITTSAISYTTAGICNYAANGTYYSKVTVTRQGVSASATTQVDVYRYPTADIKADNSNGPVSIANGGSSSLTWTSANATSCTASGDWSGSKVLNNSTGVSTGVLTTAGDHTYTLTCSNPAATSDPDSVVVKVAAAFDYSLTNSGNVSVTQGSSVTNTITATKSAGTAEAVTFSAGTLPAGVTASFSPTACTPSGANSTCTSTVTLSTVSTTSTGDKTITINGSPGSKTTSFTLTVNNAFDYSLTNNGNTSVVKGQSVTRTITATKTGGTTQSVSLSTISLPGGMTSDFSSTTCNPTCSSTLTINTGTAAPGQYTITARGVSAGLSDKDTQFTLIVTAGFDYSLSNNGDTTVIKPNQITRTITATKSAGTAEAVTFSASGLPSGISGGGATASFSPTSCTPTGVSTSCASTLTISTTSNTNLGPFTVTVTGSPLSKTTSFTLTVYQASMTIEPSLGNVMVDRTLQFKAYYDADGSRGPAASQEVTDSASWSSNNTQKATVNNTTSKGLVTGQSPTNGINITASYNTSSAVGALSVTSQPVLTCDPSSSNPSPAFPNQNLTFTSTGGTGNFQWTAIGGTPSSGGGNGQNIFTTKFSTSGAKTITVKSGSSQSANCIVTVKTPTLSVTSLTPSPVSGDRPLNGVDLTATPAANLPGTLNYTFYCNRSDDGTNVTLPANAKFDGTNENPKTAVDVCNYSSMGTYTTKVIVEGAGLAAEKRTTVTVATPTLSAALSADPNSSQAGSLNTNLTATVSGTAPGTMNYSIWWNCDNTSPIVSVAQGACGDPNQSSYGAKFDGTNDNPKTINHTYSSVGAYTAKVIVERDTLSAEKRTTIDVHPVPNVAPTVTPQEPQGAKPPPNWSPSYCLTPFDWTLSWNFSDTNGQAQSAYQLTITDTSTGQIITDTGKINSGSSSYAIPLGILAFNKTYSWTIKVWDNDGYNILSSSAVSGSNFSTIKHTAPVLSFTRWPAPPQNIAKDQQVTLTDTTVVSGGSSKTAWNWDFSKVPVSDYTLFSATNGSQVVVKFTTSGDKRIKLSVTDSDGLWCEKETGSGLPALNVGRGIPKFKEVIPQ